MKRATTEFGRLADIVSMEYPHCSRQAILNRLNISANLYSRMRIGASGCTGERYEFAMKCILAELDKQAEQGSEKIKEGIGEQRGEAQEERRSTKPIRVEPSRQELLQSGQLLCKCGATKIEAFGKECCPDRSCPYDAIGKPPRGTR